MKSSIPVVRGALQELDIRRGVEIHHDGDLPARSGMGSSSSFAVGILHALHALGGRTRSKEQLAAEAIRLEQEVLNETVGSQDQVAAAYGGFNAIRFLPDGTFSVQPVFMPEVRMADFKNNFGPHLPADHIRDCRAWRPFFHVITAHRMDAGLRIAWSPQPQTFTDSRWPHSTQYIFPCFIAWKPRIEKNGICQQLKPLHL